MIGDFLRKHGDYREDKSFKDLTTIKMGGKILHYVEPYNIDDLKAIITYIRENHIDYKILGNGSNLIVGSNDYNGVVINLKHFDNYEITNTEVYVEAGILAPYFAQVLASAGLSGFEFASGIPGTIGGLIYMNAGAYKKEIGDIIKEVNVLRDNEIVTLKKEDLKLAYRYSIFKEHPHWTVISCVLKLENKDSKEIKALMQERLERRQSTQPLDKPSAGSCFRNPDGVYAWKLIDELGYRGYKLNDVEVSNKHSNFIINNGCGKAEDYLSIVYDIQDKVAKEYNIKLIMEVEKFNC